MAPSGPLLTTGKRPPLVPRWMNRLTAPNSAPAPLLRLHRWLYVRSDGRIGPGMIGAWTLLLRTTGRRSGEPRTAALVFAEDGDRVVLGASNEGKDAAPGWFHNLRADPEVEVQIGRQRIPALAAVLEASDPDRPRLWELLNRTNNGRFDAYQSKTTRPIAVVVVEPTTDRWMPTGGGRGTLGSEGP